MIKFLTWDTGIIVAFGLLLAYSLLIRKHKALATLVSLYIAYLVTNSWSDKVIGFFTGDQVFAKQIWIQTNVSPFVIQALLLAIITLLLSSFIKLGGRRSRYSSLEVLVYAFCAMGLGLIFLLSFMPLEMRDQVLVTSKIMPVIFAVREWLLIIPLFVMVFFGIYTNDDQ